MIFGEAGYAGELILADPAVVSPERLREARAYEAVVQGLNAGTGRTKLKVDVIRVGAANTPGF